MTRGEKVIAFVERYCRTPSGAKVGGAIVLEEFQKEFILSVYDNEHGTRRAYLSIGRKNGKTALIACLVLAHLVGPEAKRNSQIISGALSREQASIVYDLASKMVAQSPELSGIIREVPSSKKLVGLPLNTEYRAISAEGKTAHGLSPVLAIIDELGQVRGPQSDFVDAVTTSQGAHDSPILMVISTQAPNDADMLSIWLDDAKNSKDPRIVSRVYEADKDCNLLDEKAWKSANPALGRFRNLDDVREQADRASRMPSFEPTFRNLVLNQRCEVMAPFISKGVWILNSEEPDPSVFYEEPVFVGLDLSSKTDLTAMVLLAYREKWHVGVYVWTPEKGLKDRAKRDRAPYDVWESEGLIRTIPGASIDYESVAKEMAEILQDCNVQAIAFDRWRFDFLKKELDELGVDWPLKPFGQGFRDMAPAIDRLEEMFLNEQIAHGNHKVLEMCMANTRIERDAAGNRKMNKAKSTGRIDAAVALAMAVGVLSSSDQEINLDGFLSSPISA